MTIVRVKVLFFGMLKDIVGRGEDHIEVADGARLESVFMRYARQFPRLTDLEVALCWPATMNSLIVRHHPRRGRNRISAAGKRRLGALHP